MSIEFGSGFRTPYVLSTTSNGKSKLRLTSTQVIYIIMGSMFYPSCIRDNIQIGLRLVNLRFAAHPSGPSQETGDP